MAIEVLDIEDLRIPVICSRSNRKTLAIFVNESGELQVKAPNKMTDLEIERFLKQKRYWIYKQVLRAREKKKNSVVRSEEEIRQLRETARKVLTEKTDFYKSIIGVDYSRIRIGEQKTRWGSCSSKGTISYNWKLVLMPDTIMNYVVVHELCHFLEMNHSEKFWNHVEEVIPDYRKSRKWLKENGNQYL